MPTWLTVAEAAEYAKYSPDSIRHALKSGELRGYQNKPGGKWRVTQEDVDAWIKGEDPPDLFQAILTRGSLAEQTGCPTPPA